MQANNPTDQWREILRECIVFGMLFKAVAKDASSLDQFEIKMSYRVILDAMSAWAERKHHDFRRQFERMGGKIHSQGTKDGFTYVVLVTLRGMQHENIYNIEILRAECQDRLNNFLHSIHT